MLTSGSEVSRSRMRSAMRSESSTSNTFIAGSLRPRRPEASLHESIAERIRRDVGIGNKIHLLQNPAAIGADGLDAQAQLVRDIRHCLARGKLAENLELALRKLRV